MKKSVIQYYVLLASVGLVLGCHHHGMITKSKPLDQEFIVDAACGQCQLGLPGDSCDLAVRIDGKAYFVDGTSIDDHGNAHGSDGFCNSVRQARVQGRVEKGRFLATFFSLMPNGDANREHHTE